MTKTYTRADFEPLSEAEALIFEDGFDGEIFYGQGLPSAEDAECEFRAELLVHLFLGEIEGLSHIASQHVSIKSVRVLGPLELSRELVPGINFIECIFDDVIHITLCDIKYFGLKFCQTIDVNLSTSEIRRGLSFHGTTILGKLILNDSTIHAFSDTRRFWPEVGKLFLRGIKIGRFVGDAPTSARARLDWLSRMPYFHPQPYKEIARVMREAGRDADARAVLYEMEWLHACDQKTRTAQKINYLRHGGGKSTPVEEERYHGQTRMVSVERLQIEQWGRDVLNWASDVFVGYGYRLERALYWYLALVALLSFLAFGAYRNGEMAPNAAPILTSAPYVEIDNPYLWANSQYAADWEDFAAVTYAFDVVTPIISFGQTDAWAPSTRGTFGWILWWLRWPMQVLGWIIASFVATSITGLMQKRHG